VASARNNVVSLERLHLFQHRIKAGFGFDLAARSFFLATEFSSQAEKFWVGPSVPAYAGLFIPSLTKPDQSVAWSM
jgi:hypothetical protein